MTILQDDGYLFNTEDLHSFLDKQKQQAFAEAARYDEKRILTLPLHDLAEELVERYRLMPLELDESGITMEKSETEVATARIQDCGFIYRAHQSSVPGTAFSFFVPFRGDASLFRFQPSSFGSMTPRGGIEGSHLVMNLIAAAADARTIREAFDQRLARVRQFIQNQRPQVDDFNRVTGGQLPERLQTRKDEILKTANTMAGIGFPLRQRSNNAATYPAPNVRRKLRIAPSTPSAPFEPEPVVLPADYEHILSVMEAMTLVLERSPSAFRTMGEEDLRQHFLVQLNGHYEGAATAETFNSLGKTDILIRQDGQNVFIAECKFWKGPAAFSETIDQLLR